MGVYVIIFGVIVFLLEITWAITLFLQVCIRTENNPLLGVWEVVLWVDRWKKSIIYVGFSIILFIRPHRLWLSSVAGVMLVGLAGLYLILTCGALFQSSKDSLLDNREESYDRFDDVQEVMDDIIPGAATSTHDSLSDQDAIMEI